jgi:hypothetical protein
VESLERAGDLATLLDRLRMDAAGESAVLGIDTPIGLPARYAERAGISRFPDFLRHGLGTDEWAEFASIARAPGEVHPRRPFYPARPGESAQAHLLTGLGAASPQELRRRCERVPVNGRLPGLLFWTLGGNQTGRGALVLWTRLLAPALRQRRARLWPFDGDLPDLLEPDTLTIVESYPTALAELVNARVPAPGKRDQAARATAGIRLLAWCAEHDVLVDAGVEARVRDGFGPPKSGEDPFDAVAGLVGMIAVLSGRAPTGLPGAAVAPEVRTVEGWMLGVVDATSTEPAG